MKISGTGQVSNVAKSKNPGKAGGDGSFSKMLDSVVEDKEISSTGSIGKINPVSFINTIDDEEQARRRKLATAGDDLLDELGKIRDALLGGNLSGENLRAIQQKIDRIQANCTDPRLNGIIEEIKLRAAVELAKLGLF